MKQQNKISIITVTYNAASTLGVTLNSVKAQSYKHIEHVIVDGNSTDDTVKLIKKYADEKVVWISQADKGIYDAMNKATMLATGSYLCFLNAGDEFYDNNTVDSLMKIAQENNNPDILYGETVVVDKEGHFLHNRRLRAPQHLTWKSFKQGMLVCHQAFIIKRSIFEPYNLDYQFSSDVDWCIRMMKGTDRIVNTNKVLIRYLNEGVTTANKQASLKERYKIMNKHYGRISTFLYHIWFVIRAIANPEKKY